LSCFASAFEASEDERDNETCTDAGQHLIGALLTVSTLGGKSVGSYKKKRSSYPPCLS
jgi:hypothetical protein